MSKSGGAWGVPNKHLNIDVPHTPNNTTVSRPACRPRPHAPAAAQAQPPTALCRQSMAGGPAAPDQPCSREQPKPCTEKESKLQSRIIPLTLHIDIGLARESAQTPRSCRHPNPLPSGTALLVNGGRPCGTANSARESDHQPCAEEKSEVQSRTPPALQMWHRPRPWVGPDPTRLPPPQLSRRRHCAASQWRAARRLRTNPARESNPNLVRKKSPSCSRELYRSPSTLTSASPVSRPRPHAPAATPTHCPAALHCWSMAGGRAARPTLLARATTNLVRRKSLRFSRGHRPPSKCGIGLALGSAQTPRASRHPSSAADGTVPPVNGGRPGGSGPTLLARATQTLHGKRVQAAVESHTAHPPR